MHNCMINYFIVHIINKVTVLQVSNFDIQVIPTALSNIEADFKKYKHCDITCAKMKAIYVVFCLIILLIEPSSCRTSGNGKYYSLLGSNKSKRQQPTLETIPLTSSIVKKERSNSMSLAISVLQNTAGLGLISAIVLFLYRQIGGLDFPWNREAEALQQNQLKQGQDDIWNEILKLKQTQSEYTTAVEQIRRNLEDVKEQLTSGLSSTDKNIAEMSTRVEFIEQANEELAKSSELSNFDSLLALENSLIAAEDRLEKESAASRAGIEQLREEVPAMLQRHDITIAQKLGKFKDDLKLLLERLSKQRKSSNGSANGNRKDR